ncbi:MAG TPA: transcriptional repressor [Alphaproteobacteria bacterium]|jgi:Fur family zinc uptake transcriptional regulator|nr:transcriptional repressor [Alphaproteobacteria bacterium]
MSANAILAPFLPGRHDHGDCVGAAMGAAEEICRARGLRLTARRRRVLELIWQQHRPVGAYDLLERLRRERGRAAPPTVYRALDFLRENGFVHRIESLNAYVGCGAPGARHSGQFLICRRCRAVAELDDTGIAEMIDARARAAGFEATGQTIEVSGLCPQCSAAPPR